jgi:carbonic anhydrase/acetyltransferase-like protein (isoleucine patch superfamily)
MAIYALGDTKPTIGQGVYVAPNATVLGDVVLGDLSSVWFGCVVRGDVFSIRIGSRTNIQDLSVVHVTQGLSKTTIGDDVTVGHCVLLHGCTIGNRVLVGMGSTILDDAVIGDDCVVGAGSLVTPRTVIPPRSLVMGRPARVVRPVTDADLSWIAKSAEAYVENAKRYRDLGLVPAPQP